MHLFTCKVCDKVVEAPRPGTGSRKPWLKENKGSLKLTCCKCLGIPDSVYITIIETLQFDSKLEGEV